MKEEQIREAKILIVDDQEDSVSLLQQMLQRAGSLRRGKHRRALASCAPFCKCKQSRRAAPTETKS